MPLSRLLDHALLLLLLLGVSLLVLKRELLIPSRRARWALRLAFACWALLWISATPAFSGALLLSLEPSVPSPEAVVPAALRSQTALVVLGSGVGPAIEGIPPRERLDSAARARIQGAARWYQLTQPAAVIVTGIGPDGEPRASAEAMADALAHSGVPRDRILLEPRATNTRENALYSVELGRARGITRFVVVTSALHLRRALGDFRRAGVEPEGAPVDYIGSTFRRAVDLVPSAGSLARTEQCLHEFLGTLKP